MSKTNKTKKGGKQTHTHAHTYPFVSICTPTFNRRPFYETTIQCFQNQTYPKDRMEWIIIDDGTDKIGDLVKHIPQVRYFPYEDKMFLGKKRNLMHEKCKGDIIVYMDDDDYYPPERVSHAVEMLQKNPTILIAGSSEMYIYFKHVQQMYQFGPYGANHATAATFAFRKELLKETKYDNHAALAEERDFLKMHKIPMIQLDPMKTILVFSHIHNSFDKKTLLVNVENNKYTKLSSKTVDDFVKEPGIRDFFMDKIENLLVHYDPGKPENKPDVLQQIEEMKVKRQNDALKNQQQQDEVTKKIAEKINQQNAIINTLLQENKDLKEKLATLSGKNAYLNEKISELITKQICRIKDTDTGTDK